jgi:hypothetical protein
MEADIVLVVILIMWIGWLIAFVWAVIQANKEYEEKKDVHDDD